MKPAFSYYGGKQRMASRIVPLLPKHTVYVEPFCGGASVFFAKPWPAATNNNHYREVLNDTNGQIVNFFRVLQDEQLCSDLLRRLYFTPYARAEYEKAKASEVNDAWAWITLVSQSYANKPGGGWGTSVIGRNQSATWRNRVSDLWQAADRLLGVHIESTDALDCIKRWDSPQTLFYCDPPYPGTYQGPYAGYTSEDFNALVAALDACEGSFVLSNYEQPGVPEHWERFEFNTKSHASNGKRRSKHNTARTEIVWRMDRHKNARPDLLVLMESEKFGCYT